MAAIFDALRPHYDIIVVDTPPLMPLADSHALAELADWIVLAVGWDRTPRDILARAVEFLDPVHERILGTVLTRVDLRQLRFYDYYGSSAYLKPYGYGAAPAPRQEAAE